MDVMLGLAPPITQCNEGQLGQIVDHNHEEKFETAKRCALIQDTTLNEAVNDFERTFQRSKINHLSNLPDVTAVSGMPYKEANRAFTNLKPLYLRKLYT